MAKKISIDGVSGNASSSGVAAAAGVTRETQHHGGSGVFSIKYINRMTTRLIV